MIEEDLRCLIIQWPRQRLAIVARSLDADREIVSTQVLADPMDRPNWERLIADVRCTDPNSLPEAS